MEAEVAAAGASPSYVSWAEVNVTNDRRRREVRYYLKRRDGASDLAVVGKEKGLRRMSYCLAIRSPSVLFSNSPFMRFKSREEVVDWLESVVSNSLPHESSHPVFDPVVNKNVSNLDDKSYKEHPSWKMGHFTREFMWLGSPWTCRKKRKHYQAFCHNGVKISIYDFVYVLAEANNRLVAYLEDMYEDSKGSKMVVVRWFHKIDEVGIILPHSFSDREIFFSLCLQDLSIECIDGLATVLSPQHYEQFLKTMIRTRQEPFVCHKQLKDDDVRPFDITQVKGYWKQDVIRCLYASSSHPANCQQPADDLKVDGNLNDGDGIASRPRKRQCRLNGEAISPPETDGEFLLGSEFSDVLNFENKPDDCKKGVEPCSLNRRSSNLLSENLKQNSSHHLRVGSKVEVLSQDSGIRECWFRALIIKKHKDKVKVQYQDIQDAADESKKLEEWITASRTAGPDQYGIRFCFRKIIRPSWDSREGKVSCVIDVGAVVDVWRHDGWWEGIVVKKDSEDKLHIYFPGEKFESVVGHGDVRESQEWVGNEWKRINGRPNVASSILASLNRQELDQSCDLPAVCNTSNDIRIPDVGIDKPTDMLQLRDLTKDSSLSQLKWSSSKKRRRASGNSAVKNLLINDGTNNRKINGSKARGRISIPKRMKVDHENCKYIGDSSFSSSVVPPLTNLVMSR